MIIIEKWQKVALLRPHFSCLLRHNRILAAPAVARRERPFASDHPKTRVVTRLAAIRAACFRHSRRRQTMQKGTVKWFNPTKGYGIHSAFKRREGRVRPHLGGRARWSQHTQRRPERRIRARNQSRQGLSGESEGFMTRSASGPVGPCELPVAPGFIRRGFVIGGTTARRLRVCRSGSKR